MFRYLFIFLFKNSFKSQVIQLMAVGSLLLGNPVFSQSKVPVDSITKSASDSNAWFSAIKRGKVEIRLRYFFMATDNAKGLSDYHAHAVGGGLKFESASFHHLHFGIGGSFVNNIHSSDFTKPDADTRQKNRYEMALFNINDLNDKTDLSRLEELYISYKKNHFSITAGRQQLTTPFINPQDGRMQSTFVEGIYAKAPFHDKWKLEGGWLLGIMPRSTIKWFTVSQSIGIYPQGVNRDGSNGNYAGHLASKGIGIVGLTFQPVAGVKVQGWEQYTDNIFNTAMLQADVEHPIGNGKLIGALQYIRQDAVLSGGNTNQQSSYFDKENKVNILGAKVGWKHTSWQASLNYTRIGNTGRFTMPREWGTEPLFTFLSRERNEGSGGVNAVMAKIKGSFTPLPLSVEVGYGHYYMPPPQDAALNKYGLPSYRHLKVLTDYAFTKTWKGLDVAFLLVYKGALGTPPDNSKYIINRVNMLSYNAILNYHF